MKKIIKTLFFLTFSVGFIEGDTQDPHQRTSSAALGAATQVIIVDDRPLEKMNGEIFIGYKTDTSDQSLSTNLGKIEAKSSKNPVSTKFMVPPQAKALTFDATQKTMGNLYMSYKPGQGYRISCDGGACDRGSFSINAVYNK